jgi:predicted nicotinamide N-methyase
MALQTSPRSDSLRRRYLSLQRRASARFDWHWAPVKVAGQIFKIATASDPEAMLIDACKRQDSGQHHVIDPFWAAVWRASAGLDQYLSRRKMAGLDVLELGCGTGRAGIAAALLGANVVLTDGVSDPLLLAELSVWPLRHHCQVQRLRFGEDRLVNRDGSVRKFPLLIGSDVTYLRELWPQMMRTANTHLTADGVLLLSDPHRLIANEFLEWIDRTRYDVSIATEVLDDDPGGRAIRIVRIRHR